MHFCGNNETFGAGAEQYRLPTNRPTYCIRCTLPGITPGQFRQACKEAFGRWSKVCDVTFIEVDDPNAAQFLIVNHQFDGSLGVLADCMLPTPGIRQQRMRIDQSENWVIADNVPANRIELRAVLCHEMGHGLGLQHFPNGPPPELMEASYKPSVVRPQQTEALFAAKLYGQPKDVQQPSDPTVGPPVTMTSVLEQGSKRWEAKTTFTRIA